MLYYLELCEYGVDSALVVQISRFNTCLDAVTFKSKLPTDGYIVQLSVAMKASLLLLRCTTIIIIIIKRILFTCRIHKSFESMLQCSIECQRAWRVV
jgi:hypothetical protein